MSGTTTQTLQLGNFTFYGFEVPDELPNLFGEQKYAVHDFSGGDRTVQELGAFPFDSIEWHGRIFEGTDLYGTPDAVARASQLNTMRVMGTVQDLVWGPFQYTVLVKEFEIIGKLKQYLEYRIKLIPIFDKTTTSNQPATAANPTALVFDANQGVTKSITTPIGTLLPPAILAAASILTSVVTTIMINASGNVSNVNATQQAAIQAQITALQLTLNPIIAGSDSGQAAAAAILSANLFTLSSTFGIGQALPIAILTVSNPNLALLASQYYGDASLWQLIAQQNNLQDMLPIGTFTLVIPQSNLQSPFVTAIPAS